MKCLLFVFCSLQVEVRLRRDAPAGFRRREIPVVFQWIELTRLTTKVQGGQSTRCPLSDGRIAGVHSPLI